MLLLRGAVGIVVLTQGGLDLAARADPTTITWLIDVLAMASGASLCAGFLTPIAAALVALNATGIWFSIVPATNLSLFASKPSAALLAAIAAAIVLLGPGAFSIDARLFGLREIIIPPRVPTD